jgi:hypothetical protein
MEWAEGKLVHGLIHAAADGAVEIRASLEKVSCGGAPVPAEKTEYGIRFAAKKGETYILS